MTYPPQSPPPYGPYGPYLVAAPQPPSSGMAVASMVLGIVGLLSSCCALGIPSLLAVIFGHVAIRETKSGVKSGHGMAVAGLVLGYVFFLPAVILSIWVLFGAGMSTLPFLPAIVELTPTPTP
jgi:Domain of unknown function (DUF4190)